VQARGRSAGRGLRGGALQRAKLPPRAYAERAGCGRIRVQAQRAGQRDHGAVVRAEGEVGEVDLGTTRHRRLMQPRPQQPVRADAPRDDQPSPAGRVEGGKRLGAQDINHRGLEFTRDVGLDGVGKRRGRRSAGARARDRQHGGLQARKAEIEVAGVEHRARQRHGTGAPALGQRRERGTAGIRQAEELRGLVERLARRVVQRVAEQAVGADARDIEELAVPPGHEQRHERKVGPRLGEQRGQEMPFEMMNADHGLAERDAQRVGNAGADEQRAREAGPLRVRDAVEVREGQPGLAQDVPHQRETV